MMSKPAAKGQTFRFDAATGTFHVLGRSIRVPRSRVARISLGSALVVGGIFGFLPILGVWMIPVGLLILSQDFAVVRRWRRAAAVWFGRRWGGRKARGQGQGKDRRNANDT